MLRHFSYFLEKCTIKKKKIEGKACKTAALGFDFAPAARTGWPGCCWSSFWGWEKWRRRQMLSTACHGTGHHPMAATPRRRAVLHHQYFLINKAQRALPARTHSTSHPHCAGTPSLSLYLKPQLGTHTVPVPCAGSTTNPWPGLSASSLLLLLFLLPPTRGSLVKSDNRRGGMGGDREKPGFPN